MKPLFLNSIIKFLVAVIWLFPAMEIQATHIVGGEIFYESLPNNNYLITLIVYRDCGPANVNQTDFDQSASVGIFSTTSGNLYDNFLIQLIEYLQNNQLQLNFQPFLIIQLILIILPQ